MEKERKIKLLSLCVLIVAVLGLTIAFAALSQTLTINGSATAEKSSWDVRFENLNLSEKTGTAEVSTSPSLTETTISGLNISLSKPGDKIIYEFDLVNNGSIDAKLTDITINTLLIKELRECMENVTSDCLKKYDVNNIGTINSSTLSIVGSAFDVNLYEGDTPVKVYTLNKRTGKESGLWVNAHETKHLKFVVEFRDNASFTFSEQINIFDSNEPAISLTFEQK